MAALSGARFRLRPQALIDWVLEPVIDGWRRRNQTMDGLDGPDGTEDREHDRRHGDCLVLHGSLALF